MQVGGIVLRVVNRRDDRGIAVVVVVVANVPALSMTGDEFVMSVQPAERAQNSSRTGNSRSANKNRSTNLN